MERGDMDIYIYTNIVDQQQESTQRGGDGWIVCKSDSEVEKREERFNWSNYSKVCTEMCVRVLLVRYRPVLIKIIKVPFYT